MGQMQLNSTFYICVSSTADLIGENIQMEYMKPVSLTL